MLERPEEADRDRLDILRDKAVDCVNGIRFEPEGLQFASSASLTMSYANCSLVSRLLPKKIAYTTDDLRILELLPSLDLSSFNRVRAPLQHFSQYAVAW